MESENESDELRLRREFIDKKGLEQEFKNYYLKRKNSQQVGGDSNNKKWFTGPIIAGTLIKFDKDGKAHIPKNS